MDKHGVGGEGGMEAKQSSDAREEQHTLPRVLAAAIRCKAARIRPVRTRRRRRTSSRQPPQLPTTRSNVPSPQGTAQGPHSHPAFPAPRRCRGTPGKGRARPTPAGHPHTAPPSTAAQPRPALTGGGSGISGISAFRAAAARPGNKVGAGRGPTLATPPSHAHPCGARPAPPTAGGPPP